MAEATSYEADRSDQTVTQSRPWEASRDRIQLSRGCKDRRRRLSTGNSFQKFCCEGAQRCGMEARRGNEIKRAPFYLLPRWEQEQHVQRLLKNNKIKDFHLRWKTGWSRRVRNCWRNGSGKARGDGMSGAGFRKGRDSSRGTQLAAQMDGRWMHDRSLRRLSSLLLASVSP